MAVLIVLGVSGKWQKKAWQKREEKMLGSKILRVRIKNSYLGGGFKYFLFHPYLRK